MRFLKPIPCSALVCALLLLAACSVGRDGSRRDSGPPPGSIDVSRVPDAKPKIEPKSECGNPRSYKVFGRRYRVLKSSKGFVEKGIASWYGRKFHGRRTSSCETYDMYAMTAAHKHLPLPTYVEVTNLRNGRKVVVRVNDRGPFHSNRVIDLSYTAAAKLGMLRRGTALVRVRAIDPRRYRRRGGAPVYSRAVDPGGAAGAGVRKTGAGTPFYIQVGAFSERRNAERLKNRLGVALGRQIRISPVVVAARRVYRVQIGPLTDVAAADNIVAMLDEYGVREHSIALD